VTDDASDLLVEMRALAERFPLPHPLWHNYVPQMHAMIVDLTAALAALADLPRSQENLVAQVEGDADYPAEDAGGAAIASARRRLRALPIPQGEHPYLDEILLTLEAAEAALAALATAEGDRTFAAALARLGSLG
jgi:hypothetical protein